MVKRIEFIDLAKGVCILIVILAHVGVDGNMPGLMVVRMPLYFILSGLFYKDYSGSGELILRKMNKLLIPFLFFYVLSYVLFYLVGWIMPGIIKSPANGILDLFVQEYYFNGPIWFLLALFWCNLFCCFIHFVTKKVIFRILGILIMGGIGCWLGKMHIFLPCKLDSALTAMPFFYFGYMLQSTSLLYSNKYDGYSLLLVLLLWIIAFVGEKFFNIPFIGFNSNDIIGNIFVIYPLAIIEVLCLLLLCKLIKRLPFISYCGRYSIILLCTHHLLYRPIKLVFIKLNFIPMQYTVYITAILTILCCYLLIPLCIKYIPYFTAQKDLIKIK